MIDERDELLFGGDDSVFFVRLRTEAARSTQAIPERHSLRGVELMVHRLGENGIYGGDHWLYEGDDIPRAFNALENVKLPIVGFNLLNYGWRVASRENEVGRLIPRTIDVFDGVASVVEAFYAKHAEQPLPPKGSLREATLLEHNPSDDLSLDPVYPADSTCALWFQLITTQQVTVAGQQHRIGKQVRDQLTGHTPRFPHARAWAESILETGSTRPTKIPKLQSALPLLEARYGSYLLPHSTI